jgi:hypothetical protein
MCYRIFFYLIPIFTFCAQPYSLFADGSNWQKAYVLTPTVRDTVYGEIKFEGWRNTPKMIEFRTAGQSTVQTFYPQNCKGFGLQYETHWEHYLNYTIELEISETDLTKITMDKQPKYKKEVLFLRAIYTGTAASLWEYEADNRMHLFLQKEAEIPTELVKKRYYTDVNSTQIADNDMYKQELFVLFAKCEKAKNLINWLSLPYKDAQIAEVIAAYNTCQDSPTLYKIKKEDMTAKFGILAAVSASALKIQTTSATSESPMTLAGTGGVSLNLILPRTQKKWSIYNDLLYFSYTANTNNLIIGQYSSTYYSNIKSYFNFSYLKLNTMVRYTFAQSKVQPYIGLGLSNGIALKAENTYLQSNFTSGTDATLITDNMIDKIRQYEQGVILDFGFFPIKKVGINARAEISNGFSPFSSLNTSVSSLYLMLHYTF